MVHKECGCHYSSHFGGGYTQNVVVITVLILVAGTHRMWLSLQFSFWWRVHTECGCHCGCVHRCCWGPDQPVQNACLQHPAAGCTETHAVWLLHHSHLAPHQFSLLQRHHSENATGKLEGGGDGIQVNGGYIPHDINVLISLISSELRSCVWGSWAIIVLMVSVDIKQH